jgi:hypothetical protein
MTFGDIQIGGWFLLDGQLCQRLAPLNTANTYNFDRAAWAWTNRNEKVLPTIAPVHLVPRIATEVEAGDARVLYWHPCGHWDLCTRGQLLKGEPFVPLSALPRMPVLRHGCPHEQRPCHVDMPRRA